MSTNDTCCTIVPYFRVSGTNLEAFKLLCAKAVEETSEEPKCLFYGYSFAGDMAFCREGYEDAQGVLAHLKKVTPVLREMLALSELVKLEIHGPKTEIDQLREPLAEMNPTFYTLEYGFRR